MCNFTTKCHYILHTSPFERLSWRFILLVTSSHILLQKIFAEPGSLSMTTIDKLREKCRQRILEEESGQP